MRSGDVAAAMSAQCALEDNCLVFWDTTTAQEALEAFESTGRTVGILQARICRPFCPLMHTPSIAGQLNVLSLESDHIADARSHVTVWHMVIT